MKTSSNTTSKLQLRKETIRTLTAHDLKLVAGNGSAGGAGGIEPPVPHTSVDWIRDRVRCPPVPAGVQRRLNATGIG